MKILALGLDKSVLEPASPLARRLVGYGAEVERYDLIVPSPNRAISNLSINVNAYGSGGKSKLIQLARLKLLAVRLIIKNRYQVLSVQDQYYLGLLAWLLARFFGLGLEAQVHGWEKKSGLRLMIAKFLIKRADSVRVVSERLKKEIMNNFSVQPEKITVAPIFSPLPASSFELRKNRSEDRFVFLTIGRLVPVKNIALQIKSLARLKERFPRVELWVAGDGRERGNLEKAAADLEIADKVKFLGWQNTEELERVFSQADCFLLTSNEEGYGLAAVEAAARALPIIMTDVGLAGEFIKDGENGLIVPVGDEAGLEKAMIKIMADEGLAGRLGENARLAAAALPDQKTNFSLYKASWQKAAECLNGRIKKIAKEHGLNLLTILLFVSAAVFIRYSYGHFTTWASDSVQYMETAEYFLGQGGGIYPQRILKPLAPLGIGLISFFTGGNMLLALLAEAAIAYLLLGWSIYWLLWLFFKDKRSALFGSIIYISAYPLLKFGLDLYTETGANLFWVWAIIAAFLYYKNPSTWKFYLCNFIVMIGLLWKEYSLLGAALLWVVVFFHPLLPRPEKIKKIIISAMIVFGWLVLVQLVVFIGYQYSYLNWYQAGTDTAEGTDYHPYFIIKSLIAVFLLAWSLVIIGLGRWREFSREQKFFIKCLVPPSMMFLLWTGVSSRLYYVAAPPLAFLAVQGLNAPWLKKTWLRIIVISIIVAGNFFWLFASDNFRSIIQMSQWR